MELYKAHRPESLDEVIGQDEAVKVLKSLKEIPHAILFSGPSGVGKTTLARVLKNKLKISDHDFVEKNAADFRSIDTIREIRQQMSATAMGGKARMWLLDEVHMLLGPAQQAFLKILEDTPEHVYFVLCTTEPNRLLRTVQTRCTHIALKSLSAKHITEVVQKVCKREKVKLSKDVVEKIVESSEGSARQALVILNQIIDMEDEDDQLAAIAYVVPSQQAIEIARKLMSKAKWPELQALLKNIDEEPETLRHMILGYCTTILLSGNVKLHARAAFIIENFTETFIYTKKAGLVATCYGCSTLK